jgi:hypothetical protein
VMGDLRRQIRRAAEEADSIDPAVLEELRVRQKLVDFEKLHRKQVELAQHPKRLELLDRELLGVKKDGNLI